MAAAAQTPKYDAPFEAQFDPDRAQEHIILRLLRRIHTATPVKVLAVHPGIGRAGTVDVQPLILDQDTNGIVIPQTPAYGLPFFRLTGGRSGIVIDPVVGDIGLAVFAERDTSNVVRTRDEGAAPTDRTYSSADGFYFGGVLNDAPAQYLVMDDDGVSLFTPDALDLEAQGGMTVTAPTIDVTGTVDVTGDLNASTLHAGNGATGVFISADSKTITVVDGIITNIA